MPRNEPSAAALLFRQWMRSQWEIYSTKTRESRNAFCLRIGMDPSTFSKWLNVQLDPIEQPRSDYLKMVSGAIGRELGYDEGKWEEVWCKLRLGDQSVLLGSVIAPGLSTSNTSAVITAGVGQYVPLISSTAAGDPIDVIDNFPPGACERRIWCPDAGLDDKLAFALRIEGDSMYPRIIDGDIVIVSPKREPQPGKSVVFKIDDEKTSCKLYKPAGDFVHFVPVNPAHEVQTYKREEVLWVYPIFALHREYP